MKNIKLNINPKQLGIAVLVTALLATILFGALQIAGLKRRVTSTENRLNYAGFYSEAGDSSDQYLDESKNGDIKVEVISQSDKSILTYGPGGLMDESDKTRKNVRMVVIKITNNNVYPIDFGGMIRGQIDGDGKLLESLEEINEDGTSTYNNYFSIAPGGTTETKLYYELKPGQKLVGLYDSNEQKTYKL